MGCPKGCRRRRCGPSPGSRHPPDGRLARSSRAPAAPAGSPAAHCSGPTSSTTTTGRRACPSTSRPAGWCPRAARTSTRAGPPPATAPTSSASPSGSPRPTRGGGSTGTRCSTRPSRSRCSHSTPTAAKRPAPSGRRDAGVSSAGIDLALLVSAAGARLIDLTTDASTPVEHTVDTASRSFLARLPRSVVEPTGTWTVRLAAGLANDDGDGFADVPSIRGAPTRAAERVQRRLPHSRAGKGTSELLVRSGAGGRADRRRRVRVLAGRSRGTSLPNASPPMSPSSEAPRPGGTSPRSSWGRALPRPTS